MEKHSTSDSNLSVDSLEAGHNDTSNRADKTSDDNVDTILVPFYENDVLIKVPKDKKVTQKKKETNKRSKPSRLPTYLANKDRNKNSSYLNIFHKQIEKNTQKKTQPQDKNECEISSVYPEFGDTEPESICETDCASARIAEFCNSEPYNELFYEQLLSQQICNILNASQEDEELRFAEGLEENSLRSVSEISQRRRTRRGPFVPPQNNCRLGGLGPDMEAIKPRLERARSLQRYSEKIRMDNRLKIYRNLVTHDTEIEITPTTKRNSTKEKSQSARKESNTSYLVNKTQTSKLKAGKQVSDQKKTKPAEANRGSLPSRENQNEDRSSRRSDILTQVGQEVLKRRTQNEEKKKVDEPKIDKVKSISKAINTEADSTDAEIPPVQISFMVNLKGGLRSSSALRSLEEKHRMYQEKVKAYTGDNYDF